MENTVVYDAQRDATGHDMADFQQTVMVSSAGPGVQPQAGAGAA
ncbi:hypothetical protein [Paenacidovorax monticola]|nr:hypothetical protein [Paenacidovorax monticola]